MPPFPFLFLTWRESVVGFKPLERVAMQVESVSGRGARGNLGYVKWRMDEEIVENTLCQVLRCESLEMKTGRRQTEDVWVDERTGALVRQDVERPTDGGVERAVSIFFPDRIETRRTSFDGSSVWVTTALPEEGPRALDRRFAPVNGAIKAFLVFDGFTGLFRKVTLEPGGRFAGTVSGEKYEGRTYRFAYDGVQHTMMLTSDGEVVKIDLAPGVSINLTTPTASRRRLAQPKPPFRR